MIYHAEIVFVWVFIAITILFGFWCNVKKSREEILSQSKGILLQYIPLKTTHTQLYIRDNTSERKKERKCKTREK